MQSITVQELIDHRPDYYVLDVRELSELKTVCIDHDYHIPLGNLFHDFDQISTDKPIAVLCHHGVRSARACQFLISKNFAIVYNITGGIDAWADVQTHLKKY